MDNEITYLDLYKDNREHARHHESQRTTMSNLIIFISAAVSGIITLDKTLTQSDLPLTVFISVLGIFGIIFSIKYGFRIGYHLSVSRRILKLSSPEVYEETCIIQRTSEAESKYPKWIIKQQNTLFWIVLHGCITLYGTALSVICYLS